MNQRQQTLISHCSNKQHVMDWSTTTTTTTIATAAAATTATL
jgi:hypothetical protein